MQKDKCSRTASDSHKTATRVVGTIPSKSPSHSGIAEEVRRPHQVLTQAARARIPRRRAAGRKGAVTVATNMAGRGTDHSARGNPEQMTRDHFLKNKLAMPYRRLRR